MYIRKSTRTYKGKTYTNHLLVESVQTVKGPRQRTICSLGSLEPAPAEDWLGLAHKLQSALEGQEDLSGSSTEIREWVEKASNKKKSTVPEDRSRSTVTIEPDKVQVEQAREAGPVHLGHQLWRQLGMNQILQGAGLSSTRLPVNGSDDAEPFDLSFLRTCDARLDSAHRLGRHLARRFFRARGRGTVSQSGPTASEPRNHRACAGGEGKEAFQPGRHRLSV